MLRFAWYFLVFDSSFSVYCEFCFQAWVWGSDPWIAKRYPWAIRSLRCWVVNKIFRSTIKFTYKINSFADDTNLTLKDFQSILRVLVIYRCYKLASGATLKEAKNQLLLLGAATAAEVPYQLRDYVVDNLKIYGITITAEGFEDEQNWQEVQEALNLQEYKVPTLELSHYGKIGTFMTYTLSKMWYRANLITRTPQIIFKLENVLDAYLWYPSAGKHHVRKGVLKLPADEGSIAYPDVLMSTC